MGRRMLLAALVVAVLIISGCVETPPTTPQEGVQFLLGTVTEVRDGGATIVVEDLDGLGTIFVECPYPDIAVGDHVEWRWYASGDNIECDSRTVRHILSDEAYQEWLELHNVQLESKSASEQPMPEKED